MKGKPERGTVTRAFMNPDRSWACAVEFDGGMSIRADTLTRLEPGSEVEATFDHAVKTWAVRLARAAA